LRCQCFRAVQSGVLPVCLDCGSRFEQEPRISGVVRLLTVIAAVVGLTLRVGRAKKDELRNIAGPYR
jgi:hypothetical protein